MDDGMGNTANTSITGTTSTVDASYSFTTSVSGSHSRRVSAKMQQDFSGDQHSCRCSQPQAVSHPGCSCYLVFVRYTLQIAASTGTQ